MANRVTIKVKVKVKFTLQQATKAHRGVEVDLYSFFNLGARWGGWSMSCPGRFTPREDTRYPLYRKLLLTGY